MSLHRKCCCGCGCPDGTPSQYLATFSGVETYSSSTCIACSPFDVASRKITGAFPNETYLLDLMESTPGSQTCVWQVDVDPTPVDILVYSGNLTCAGSGVARDTILRITLTRTLYEGGFGMQLYVALASRFGVGNEALLFLSEVFYTDNCQSGLPASVANGFTSFTSPLCLGDESGGNIGKDGSATLEIP